MIIKTNLTQILSQKQLQLMTIQYSTDVNSSPEDVQVHLYDINNNIVGSLYSLNQSMLPKDLQLGDPYRPNNGV